MTGHEKREVATLTKSEMAAFVAEGKRIQEKHAAARATGEGSGVEGGGAAGSEEVEELKGQIDKLQQLLAAAQSGPQRGHSVTYNFDPADTTQEWAT
eukprot:4234903-Prymnesium_polylepis.1